MSEGAIISLSLVLRSLDGEALDQALIAHLCERGYVVARKMSGTRWETPGQYCARVGMHRGSFHRALIRALGAPTCPPLEVDWSQGCHRVIRLASTPEFDALLCRYLRKGEKAS